VNEPIPLARPDLGPREEELLLEVVRSGALSLGPKLEQFEHDFSDWIDGDVYAIAVSSGTAALHLGVRAEGWSAGDEVITSSLTFVASANCLLYEGVKPVFCDIDPVTLTMDTEAVAAAVGERTAGILPVHIFGYPADLPALRKIASEQDLGMLEDACQALGAHDSTGKKIGTDGNLATFAFYANKQMTTGEGGMIVPRDAADAERLRGERNQGRAADMGWLDHGGLGFNYRLSDVASALGLAQVERLDAMLAERARVASLYAEGLAGLDPVEAPIAGRGTERRSWFVYAVRLDPAVDRDATIALLGERGVDAKAYLPCIHLFPHLRELGYGEGQFPAAEAAAASSLALPFFPSMGEAEVTRVCEALTESIA